MDNMRASATATFTATSYIKATSFSDGDTVIRGIATHATPDRVNDVVEPSGVVFRTRDIKLLMHHDNRLPVGNVRFGKPDAKGLPFEATLPFITEDGTVRDRVNEAIHSIKYNLISSVSIGFRALEGGVERIGNTDAYHFKKWEMIELSLTPTPMQTEATFQVMKALESGKPIPKELLDEIARLNVNQIPPSSTLPLLSSKEASSCIKLRSATTP